MVFVIELQEVGLLSCIKEILILEPPVYHLVYELVVKTTNCDLL